MRERSYTRSPRDRRPLGEILREETRTLEAADILERVKRRAAETGQRLGEALLADGKVDPEALARALARQTGYPYLLLTPQDVDHLAVKVLPLSYQQERGILVLARDDRTISVAMHDPRDASTALEVEQRAGLAPRVWVVSRNRLERVRKLVSGGSTDLRYRLRLREKVRARLGPIGDQAEERIFVVHDLTPQGVQMSLPNAPRAVDRMLEENPRRLCLVVPIGSEGTASLKCILVWARREDVDLRFGLEFLDASGEAGRDLYRYLLPFGEHDLQERVERPDRPPEPFEKICERPRGH